MIDVLLPNVTFRVAERGDHGYGFIDTLTAELSVAVRREARGSKIGTQLLRADESYDSVSLSVSVQNPAVRLYG